MSFEQMALPLLLFVTLLAQALLPQLRLLLVLGAAGLSCLFSIIFLETPPAELLSQIPWDVIVILLALGFFSELFASSGLFGRLAVLAARLSQARLRWVAFIFSIFMFLVSGLVNNLTALLLVLPILLTLLRLLAPDQRSLSWCIGVLLVACNLGGAATPIGDFPAILLLGSGRMEFREYLVLAAPLAFLALLILLAVVHLVVRPYPRSPHEQTISRLTTEIILALYRRVKVERRVAIPAALWLLLMLLCWVFLPREWGGAPELVCWIGTIGALAMRPSIGEKLLRSGGGGEGALFLFSLFVMIAAIRETGFFTEIAARLLSLPLSAESRLVIFLLVTGVSTGVFSAGPSMSAMLEVGQSMTSEIPGEVVYIGLALSVCAGSSLFLTAATSGPLTQAMVESASLKDENGRPLRFGFFAFLPIGLVSFVIIQSVAIGYALLAL